MNIPAVLISFAFMIVPQLLFAGEPGPERIPEIYRVYPDSVVPGFSARIVADGYGIGRSIPLADVGRADLDAMKNLQEKIGFLYGLEKKIGSYIEKRTAASQREFGALSAVRSEADSSLPRADAVAAYQEFSPDLLKRCAIETLPRLKQMMRFRKIHNEHKASLIERTYINSRRYDGKRVSPSGMICGIFIGSKAGAKAELLDEVKFLQAVAGRDEDEIKILVRVYLAANHPLSPVRHGGLWSKTWKSIAMLSVFSGQKLPPVERVFRAASKNVTLKSAANSLELVIINDLNFSDIFQKGTAFGERVR